MKQDDVVFRGEAIMAFEVAVEKTIILAGHGDALMYMGDSLSVHLSELGVMMYKVSRRGV